MDIKITIEYHSAYIKLEKKGKFSVLSTWHNTEIYCCENNDVFLDFTMLECYMVLYIQNHKTVLTL